MSKLSPATEFDLALFHFRADPANGKARLERAIDAWRAAGWKGREILDKQLVTACERAMAAPRGEWPAALAGIAELVAARSTERSFARMQQELAALEREKRDKSEGEAAPARPADPQAADPEPSPALPLFDAAEPPHTRWDERADLQ
jgi:hypothetical protein